MICQSLGASVAVKNSENKVVVGQVTTNEAIRALSDSLVHITQVLASLQENIVEKSPNCLQKGIIAEGETNNGVNSSGQTFDVNNACDSGQLNANATTIQKDIIAHKFKTPKHLVPCPFSTQKRLMP